MAKKEETTIRPDSGDGSFSEEARAALAEEAAFDPADEILSELAAEAQKTTPKGRKAKAAKEATAALEMVGVLEPSLSAINELIAAKFPELRHSDDEIRTLSALSGKVLAKHVDSALSQYGDEIVLATFLAGSLTEKGFKLHRRLQREKQEAIRNPDPNFKTKQANGSR